MESIELTGEPREWKLLQDAAEGYRNGTPCFFDNRCSQERKSNSLSVGIAQFCCETGTAVADATLPKGAVRAGVLPHFLAVEKLQGYTSSLAVWTRPRLRCVFWVHATR